MHEKVLKDDAKDEFTQKANIVGSRTVGNFTTVMVLINVQIFPVPYIHIAHEISLQDTIPIFHTSIRILR